MSIGMLLIGFALGQAGAPTPAESAAQGPSLSYLSNSSVVYRECVAETARGRADPSVTLIGGGPCRQARAVLHTVVRYHQAMRWSALPANRAEERRISRQVDRSAAGIVEEYEADLQRWLDTRPAPQ